MSSYRLLRSNKETGPYSQDEMIAMGFKPYDLIWVEGKSAGWRYPSEIPELQAYAPMVEEQPYDRFYKKPVVPTLGTPFPQNTIEPAYQPEATAIPASFSPAESNRPVFSPSTASVGRHIHVTLPSGSTLNVTAVTSRNSTAPAIPASDAPYVPGGLQADTSSSSPAAPEKSFATTLTSQSRFAPVDERLAPGRKQAYTSSSDVTTPVAAQEAGTDNNSVYYTASNNEYTAPQMNSSSGYSWTTVLGMVVGIATLVGLGIMIGLSMNHSKAAAATEALQLVEHKKPAAQPENSIDQPKADNAALNSAPTDNNAVTATPAVNTNPGGGNESSTVPVSHAVQQQPAPTQTSAAAQPAANSSQQAKSDAVRQADIRALAQQGITVKNLHTPGDKLTAGTDKNAGNALNNGNTAGPNNREKVTAPAKKDTKPGEPRLAQKRADVLPSTSNTARTTEPVTVRPSASNEGPALNLEKQVNVRNNTYKVGTFGGITDLQCTVVNDSRYPLESVEVDVEYVQANAKVYKTERLSFRDISAGGKVTMNAPTSPRGVKIVTRVVKVSKREGLVRM